MDNGYSNTKTSWESSANWIHIYIYIYTYTRVLWVYIRAVRDPLTLLWVEVSVHLCKTDQFSIGEYRLRLGFCCWEPKQRETYKSLRHSDQPVYMRVSA